MDKYGRDELKTLRYTGTEIIDGQEKIVIERVKKITMSTDPLQCGDCPYIDYKGDEFGDCLLTDEEIWNIWRGIGKECPLPIPDEIKKKYTLRE